MICKRKRVLSIIGTLLTIVAPIAMAALSFLKANDLYDAYVWLFAVLAILALVLGLKNLKNPVVDGKIDYRKRFLLLYILIDGAVAGISFIGFEILPEGSEGIAKIAGVIGIGIAVIAIVFILISFFQNTRKYSVKEVIVKPEKQKLEIDTMYSIEKVKRVNQLKALNALDDKEYADSVAKFSRGA